MARRRVAAGTAGRSVRGKHGARGHVKPLLTANRFRPGVGIRRGTGAPASRSLAAPSPNMGPSVRPSAADTTAAAAAATADAAAAA